MEPLAAKEKFVGVEEKAHLVVPEGVRYDHQSLKDVPLVIDIGSWTTRVGWASHDNPQLHFESVVSKYRDRKSREQMILAGVDCFSEPTARSSMRSPYDGYLLTNVDVLENLLDYSFCKLGVKCLSDHAVFMTEPAVNMGPCRSLVSELLFEAYNVPKVAYGIDGLCSHYANSYDSPEQLNSGLIWSLGHTSSYLLPLSNCALAVERVKRLNVGGYYNADFLLKLIQLKYPGFPVKMTHRQAQHLMESECYVSLDYSADLNRMSNKSSLPHFTTVVQFPYTVPEGPTEEELAAREARKQEQVDRMRKQVASQRLTRLAEKQTLLDSLTPISEKLQVDANDSTALDDMFEIGYNSQSELFETLRKLQSAIKKLQAQINGEPVEDDISSEQPKQPPASDLVDIPDSELSSELRVQKRRQKLLLAGWEARERLRKEKEQKIEADRVQAEQVEQERLADPVKWLAEKHARRKLLLERKEQRQKLSELQSNRRSQVAQSRMRSLAALAADDNLTTTAGNRRKSRRRRNAGSDDDFGVDDDDWNVYHDIQGVGSLQDVEDAENDELEKIESMLIEHDPNFTEEDILNSTDSAEAAYNNSILYALRNGPAAEAPSFHTDKDQLADELSRAHQLRVNVERIRIPETYFQPSIMGVDQSGLVETSVETVRSYAPSQRLGLIKNIFFSGGPSLFPNLTTRFANELRPHYPIGTAINVRRAKDPLLDPWRGAALYARDTSLFDLASVSRQQWEECGHDYLQEFSLSNRFFRFT